jgi:hypothetical protein
MGISLSVAFKKKVPGHGTLGSDHTDLGDNLGRLDKLLTKAKLTGLESFVSADPTEMAELLDLDENDPGLEPVRAAIGYVESNAAVLSKVRDAVLDDLRDVETELALAESKGVAFHFCLLD